MSVQEQERFDVNKAPINIGSIVTIVGDDNSFTHFQGIVVDTNSDHEVEDGPIAVFFDKEVASYKFGLFLSEQDHWKGGVPTLESYRSCPRVVCFLPEELRVESRFDDKTVATRLFGDDMWHSLFSPKEEMVPNVTECSFNGCSQKATCHTYVNFWGSVYVIPSCAKCYSKRNGCCTEDLGLKK